MNAADYLTGKHSDQLNVICAEEAGWRYGYVSSERSSRFGVSLATKAWFPPDDREWDSLFCPDFAEDQNAARSLLALLSDEDQWRWFRWALFDIIGHQEMHLAETFKAFMLATPLQISVAFAVARGRVS